MTLYTANRYLKVAYGGGDRLTTRVVDYWETLRRRRLLEFRLHDVENPTIQNVKEMVSRSDNYCYVMYDPVRDKLCAETMLNGVQGRCAYVHFSVHPDYRGAEATQIAKAGVEQHFQTKNCEGYTLKTLFGLTPLTNKLAIRFIYKVGFKKLDIIQDMYYSKATGQYTDALLTKLRR